MYPSIDESARKYIEPSSLCCDKVGQDRKPTVLDHLNRLNMQIAELEVRNADLTRRINLIEEAMGVSYSQPTCDIAVEELSI